MAGSPTRFPRGLLLASLLCGFLALVLTVLGLPRGEGWEGVSLLVFEAVAFLGFEPPTLLEGDAPASVLIVPARLLVLLFAGFGLAGAVLELYPPARDGARRLRFWWLRRLRGEEPAVVVGLGWIGGPLARELREKGRPVYGIAVDEESPRAVEARRCGVLVLAGDATDAAVRARAGLRHAAEVFLATGDDARNVEIAGDLVRDAQQGRLGSRSRERPLACYVHAADPTLSATLRSHDLLRGRTELIDFRTFSNRELAAHDLFFDRDVGILRHAAVVPGRDEVFHLFVFGFGSTGQTIALHLARFGHFAPGLRPRLTVYDAFDGVGGEQVKQGFLDRHPAFAPPDLDLASESFLAIGDGWAQRPGRAAAWEYRQPAEVEVGEEGATRRLHPVEYAVNAEFRALPPELESSQLLSKIEARLRPRGGPAVRAAAVVCFEEERRSFHAALRLQHALAHRLLDDPAAPEAGGTPALPIFVYLPVEKGLAELIMERPGTRADRPGAEVERRFPLHAFGRPSGTSLHDAVTQGPARLQALGFRAVHEILSGRVGGAHPDFEDSDLDAALHAEAVRLSALGIRFDRRHTLDAAETRGIRVWPTPLLADLCRPEVVEQHRRFEATAKRSADGRKLRLSPAEFAAVPAALRQRLALLDRIEIPGAPAHGEESEEEKRRRAVEAAALAAAVRAELERVIHDFGGELRQRERDADLAAQIEHNRWMGERLAKGWRYGPRSDVRRQRPTFVPWEDLSDAERLYDRAHLPRLIVQRSLLEEYAYIELPGGRAVAMSPRAGPGRSSPSAAVEVADGVESGSIG